MTEKAPSCRDYIGRTVVPITRILYPVRLAPTGTYERWEAGVPRRVILPMFGTQEELDRLWEAGKQLIAVEWPGMMGYRLVSVCQVEVVDE